MQSSPMLHRIVPTLDNELAARHAQITNGLINRIRVMQPSYLDFEVIGKLLEPAPARWPEHYACWSWSSDGIQLLKTPPNQRNGVEWLSDLSRQARVACDISIATTKP